LKKTINVTVTLRNYSSYEKPKSEPNLTKHVTKPKSAIGL